LADLPANTEQDKRFGKLYDTHVMRRLWPFLAPHKLMLGSAAGCMCGVTLSHLLGPFVIKITLDDYIATGNMAGLTIMVGIYLANAVLGWLAQYGETLCIARLAQRVLLALRQALFQHLMRLDTSFYDRQPVGRLMSRVQNDVGSLQDLFASGLLNAIGDLLILLGIMVVLLSMHTTLSLITFAVLPFVVLLTAYWRIHSRRAFQRVRSALASVNTQLQENISAVRVIQSLVSEAYNLRRFTTVNQSHLDANMYAARLSSLFFPTIEIVSVVGIALVVIFGGPMVLAGSLSAGGFVAFILYMHRFFDPIRDLSFRWNYLQMAMAAGERIFALLDADVHIKEAARPVLPAQLRGEVEFRHVSFGYHPDMLVLQNVSLEVPSGQHLALVGPTGAGKTTLVNLVARFYDVRDGAVIVDGIDVRRLSLEGLRRQIGLVLQEPFLFSGTIRENLRYANPSASEQAIAEAAQAIGVHDHIMRLPSGYDTDVHERGALLSHGQRQLISFVRALLADPRILILDEATASVDTETERAIQSGLTTLLQGRTAFIIAHRLSTVKHVDRILVLQQGCIVEDGTHDELLRLQGAYHRLYATTYTDVGHRQGRSLFQAR
jgi:ATP-binding cassette subfamily B protein